MGRAETELDIIKFIRLQKLIRSLHNHLFTNVERYLLRNQICFVINSEEDDLTNSEGDQMQFSAEQLQNATNTPYFERFLLGAL